MWSTPPTTFIFSQPLLAALLPTRLEVPHSFPFFQAVSFLSLLTYHSFPFALFLSLSHVVAVVGQSGHPQVCKGTWKGRRSLLSDLSRISREISVSPFWRWASPSVAVRMAIEARLILSIGGILETQGLEQWTLFCKNYCASAAPDYSKPPVDDKCLPDSI